MKKPESNVKFVFSVIFMIMLVAGLVVLAIAFGNYFSFGITNETMLMVGIVLLSVSMVVFTSSGLFKLFFTTLFGKDKENKK